MPEMKGRSLEELDEMFIERISVRKFPSYQAKIKEEAIRDVKGFDKDFAEKSTHAELTEQVLEA